MSAIKPLWHATCLIQGKVIEGLNTLRITFQETPKTVEMTLEGRLAGPWASELDRVWVETAPQLASKKLIIDLHNVTYADSVGKKVLKSIFDQTHAEFVANTPWAQFLVEEVTNKAAVERG